MMQESMASVRGAKVEFAETEFKDVTLRLSNNTELRGGAECTDEAGRPDDDGGYQDEPDLFDHRGVHAASAWTAAGTDGAGFIFHYRSGEVSGRFRHLARTFLIVAVRRHVSLTASFGQIGRAHV